MTTNYTDQQLQLALAKMLPDKFLIWWSSNIPTICWANVGGNVKPPVNHTEWLHVCWLIEQALLNPPENTKETFEQQVNYKNSLYGQAGANSYVYLNEPAPFETILRIANLSWQQRAIALCKVKGVEIC